MDINLSSGHLIWQATRLCPLILQVGVKQKLEVVSLNIPTDTLAEVANNEDMSIEVLLKLYIGQGLKQDISKLFNER